MFTRIGLVGLVIGTSLFCGLANATEYRCDGPFQGCQAVSEKDTSGDSLAVTYCTYVGILNVPGRVCKEAYFTSISDLARYLAANPNTNFKYSGGSDECRPMASTNDSCFKAVYRSSDE